MIAGRSHWALMGTGLAWAALFLLLMPEKSWGEKKCGGFALPQNILMAWNSIQKSSTSANMTGIGNFSYSNKGKGRNSSGQGHLAFMSGQGNQLLLDLNGLNKGNLARGNNGLSLIPSGPQSQGLDIQSGAAKGKCSSQNQSSQEKGKNTAGKGQKGSKGKKG